MVESFTRNELLKGRPIAQLEKGGMQSFPSELHSITLAPQQKPTRTLKTMTSYPCSKVYTHPRNSKQIKNE